MQGPVGANLCVRPVIPGRHAGLPLQAQTKKGDLFFLDNPLCVYMKVPGDPWIPSEDGSLSALSSEGHSQSMQLKAHRNLHPH